MELRVLEKKEYEEFVKYNPYKSHFLQSYDWGCLVKKERGLTPYYLGLLDNGKIVGATLLLKKSLPLGLCYLYAPRGYVLNFSDVKILDKFTEEVVKFAKRKKAIYVKIDPDIIWKKEDYKGEVVEVESKDKKIYKELLRLGYKHLGFTKNFETAQPRYTFRIDLNQSMDEIESHFSKTTKQRIAKSIKLKTKVEIGDEKDLETFYHLMMLTEERKDFVSYDINYYKTLYKLFNEDNKATLFLGKVNIKDSLEVLKNDLLYVNKKIDELPKENMSKSAKNKLKELSRQKENLEKEVDKYFNYLKEYGDEVTLSAHMILEYGDKAWVLYAGNHNILTETYVNYHTYYEHLKFCKDRGLKIYDQFGTIGDLSKDNPRLGLHEFKKKFGGDYIEFMGEFDYVVKPIYYFAFTKLVPIYRNMIKKRKKKELKVEVAKK
ncbi:MAG TPA: peptidoglycan bridge formation glycyltransferase FemA/FemB family protein [Candidatus Onthousia faecipullorum]|uniref:Peptidoglycan bridge formation glycyltransferase FemA/FemB family protein n=1 Tax=Candidatus Onthousia faecipullorum TaxID=2840887 RepID=A0A9D1KBB3_9FIRM|nr:peptidoglycan bridge formation glycyltransferase FemA/FemB family protein [Candidatus Onthousia faecipullorum]